MPEGLRKLYGATEQGTEQVSEPVVSLRKPVWSRSTSMIITLPTHFRRLIHRLRAGTDGRPRTK
jgi:hypothetical protein